jgi:flagellin-specific chaperone FliS
MNDFTLRYREQQVFSASPLQRLLMVYDAAIVGCRRQDLARTTKALNLLSSTLNFESTPEIASRLLSLYLYCGDRVRMGDYEEPERVLRGLVQAWVEVLVKQGETARSMAEPVSSLRLVG